MIGITFEGGGTRGSYQVGSYMAFKHCHIKPHGVCGTSIGAFNGAMIAAKQEKELLEFWQTVDVAQMLKLQGLKDLKIRTIPKAVINILEVLRNKGVDTNGMRKQLDDLLDQDRLYRSRIDFGLCTVKLNSLTPLYKYKKDIPKSKIVDYILASCYLPVFKMEKIIDNSYYIDGGFYDNSPVDMLAKKGYKKIYCVGVKGIGRHPKRPTDVKIIDILPSRPLGGIINLKPEKMKENIKIGYFDTLKVLKNLDGYKYCFKKKSDRYYGFISRKVDPKLLERARKFWKAKTTKETIIKSLEFIMKEEKISYFDIYHPYKLAKLIEKNYNKRYFIYKLIYELKMF